MSDIEARLEALERDVAELKAKLGVNGAKPARPSSASSRPASAVKKPLPASTSTASMKSAASAKSSGSKLSSVRTKEEKKDEPQIDPARKRNYFVGKTKIHVTLPSWEPTTHNVQEPAQSLQLAWTFGYSGKECTDNVFYTHDGQIVYSIAATGVVLDPASKSQKHFVGHDEDILCLAYHPSRNIVATGQLDPKGRGTPYITVWEHDGMTQLKKITFHDRGVAALAFSPDGKYLASIGNDDNHTLAIWEWEKASKGDIKPLVDISSGKDVVFDIVFNPTQPGDGDEVKGGMYEFATVGIKHLKVWSATGLDAADKKDRKVSSRIPGTMDKTKVVVKSYPCAAYDRKGELLVGTDSGFVYRFKGSELTKFFSVSPARVGAIAATDSGIAVAADDDQIRLYDENDASTATIDLTSFGGANGRAMHFGNGKLVLGTSRNQLIEIDVGSHQATVVVDGHFEDVQAVTTHPSLPYAYSTGDDKFVKAWNLDEHGLLENGSIKLKGKGQSLAVSPDGKYLAVGMSGGKLELIDLESFTEVKTEKIAQEDISCLQFSPDSTMLAAGSWDQALYVLSVPDITVMHTMKGHTSSIFMLNWSEEGKYIVTNSRDYEILYWDVAKGKRVKHPIEVVDEKWFGWNCFLGWPVQGIWRNAGDGTDINSVDRSPDQSLLVAGDDFGIVRLFQYPAAASKAPYKEFRGHSSFVTSVRWANDGARVVSGGGHDTGVFLWSLT